MPSEAWGEITPIPDDMPVPVELEVGADGVLRNAKDIIFGAGDLEKLVGSTVRIALHTSDPSLPTPPTGVSPMTPVKITINGIQLGVMPGYTTRTDEIGERVVEVVLDEDQLNKLYDNHGKPQITRSDTERMVDAMGPMMEVAEELKRTLVERGWTYEEAERIAGDFLQQSIVNGMKEASK